MQVNVEKCIILHIGSNNPQLEYYLKDKKIERVQEARDLGVIVSKNLKWESHILTYVKKANTISYLIHKSFKHTTADVRLKLFIMYVRPILEFTAVIWCPHFKKDIHIIESVQRRATKRLFNENTISYPERLERLNLPSLESRRKRGDLIETYKWVHNHYDIEDQLFKFTQNPQLRGHPLKLSINRFNSEVAKHFFTNRTLPLWNALPSTVAAASSLPIFKRMLDKNNSLET